MRKIYLLTLFIALIVSYNNIYAQPKLGHQKIKMFDKNFLPAKNPVNYTYMGVLTWDGKIWNAKIFDLKTDALLKEFYGDTSRRERMTISYLDSNATIPNGPCTIYYEDGRVLLTGNYYIREMQGIWTEYDSSTGNKISEKTFVKNIRNGDYIRWYSSGELLERGKYTNNMLDSICITYHRNGQISCIYKYNLDTLQTQVCYGEDGIIRDCKKYASKIPEIPGNMGDYVLKNFTFNGGEWHIDKGNYRLKLIINEDGSVTFVDVVGGNFNKRRYRSFIEELQEKVSKMPKWSPGYQNNIAVKVGYELPIKVN
ncbi:MAG TPA: hypothetical protein VN721_07285 [Flavipsychrobacter sp.]|nr:hypothetical protein [Flavipsychrobacter sp.]